MPSISNKKIDQKIYVLLPLSLRWLGWLLSLAAFTLLLFMACMDVAKKERAQGVLHSQSDAIPVQSPVDGIVDALFVHEGEHVEKGQPLFSVSQQSYTSEQGQSLEDDAISRQKALLSEKEATLSGLPQKHKTVTESLKNQIARLNEQMAGLRAQENTASARLQLAEEQLKRMQSTSGSIAISDLELTRQKDSVLSMRQQLDALRGQKIKTESDLESLNSQLGSLKYTQENERVSLYDEIDRLKGKMAENNQRKSRNIVAATAGVVENIQVKIGKQVAPGQSQLHLLPPHQPLQLTVYAPARTVAFLSVGQSAKIRYNDFPYQRFGSYQGQVIRIGRSAIMPGETAKMTIKEPSYEVDIQLDSQEATSYGKTFPLKSGMIAEVDITTEKRSLLYWLFEPILSIQAKF